MAMYDNEFETKENNIWTSDKIESQRYSFRKKMKKRQKQTEEELSKRKCTLNINGNSFTSYTSLLFWFLANQPQSTIEEFVLF